MTNTVKKASLLCCWDSAEFGHQCHHCNTAVFIQLFSSVNDSCLYWVLIIRTKCVYGHRDLYNGERPCLQSGWSRLRIPHGAWYHSTLSAVRVRLFVHAVKSRWRLYLYSKPTTAQLFVNVQINVICLLSSYNYYKLNRWYWINL